MIGIRLLVTLLLFFCVSVFSCKHKSNNPYISSVDSSIKGTDESYNPPLLNPRALFIDDAGVGDTPVIFVHSFAGSTQHWQEQLTALRKTRRAIAFDLRAHGASPAARDKNYSVEAFASDIATVADSLGLSQFILVGQNLGADAAIAYASKFPGKVRGLLLMGVPIKTTATRVTKIMDMLESEKYDTLMNAYLAYLLTNAKPATQTMLQDGLLKLTKNGVLKMVRAGLNFDPVPGLRKYTGPVMMLSSDEDQAQSTWQQLFPKMEFKRITGTSHWMQIDKPTEFNTILQKFLKDLPRTS